MVTVPATIAEQLSVVAAFILFLVGVWAFLKWVLGWAKSLITEQRHEWQEYMKQESEKTRQWLSDQECDNRKSIGQVTEALEAVNDNLRALAEQLTKHDDKVENTFERAVDKLSNGSLYKRPPKKEDGAVK